MNYFKATKKDSTDKPAQLNPVKGTVYVAKTFPTWQQVILDKLKEMYVSGGNVFPDNKACLAALSNREELKKFQKKVMPFVACLRVRNSFEEIKHLF